MDRDRFDALTRLVATSVSRREALAALFGAGLSGLLDEAVAKKKGRGKRRGPGKGPDRNRNRRRNRSSRAGAAAEAACCTGGSCTPGPGKNLFKCCYRRQNLAGRNFRGANLGQASFAGAILTNANFAGANLDRVCFVDADLTGATLPAAASAIFCRTTMPNGSVNDGGCGRGTNCCPTCDDDSNCGNGQICCSSRCRTGDCCTSADCPADEPICTRNICGPCTGDAQCGTDRVCCNGICCSSGLRCIDNTCQEGCGGDIDCNQGQVCCDQQCRDGDCCDGDDCGSQGTICRDFTCRCGNGDACSGAARSCCGQGASAACRECCDSSNCSGNMPFCDANGACVQCLQNGDCTTSDPCRDAVCDNGTCQTTAKDDGEACAVGQDEGVCCGGACDLGARCCGNAQCTDPDRPFCDANGQCVACRNADDCDALPCQSATCPASGLCEYDNQDNGTACDDSGAGVCCGGACDVGAQCCTNAQCTTPAAPVCDANGRCVCPAGRVTCNSRCCDQDQVCNTAATPNVCCTPTKITCEAGVDCGNVSDGCGRTIDCQTCPQRECQTVACTSNECDYTDAANGTVCQIGQQPGICCGGECRAGQCCANADCGPPAFPPGTVCNDNVCGPCTANDQCNPNQICDLSGATNRHGRCFRCHVCLDPGCDTLAVALNERLFDPIYICPGEYDRTIDVGIVRDVTLYGSGSGDDPAVDTILNANGGGSVLISGGNVTATVRHLRITNGRADDGGGIHVNRGDLALEDVTIIDCHANISGGGIANVSGDVTIQNAIITGCTADGEFGRGGGVANISTGFADAETTLVTSTISGCSAARVGGGIFNDGERSSGSSMELDRSTVFGCEAGESGGGIANDGVLFLSASVITGSTAEGAGGGIFNGMTGNMTLVEGAEIRGNRSTAEPEGQGISNLGNIICEMRINPPRVCGNPGDAAATLATNCLDVNSESGCSAIDGSRVCAGDAAPGSGACSPACTSGGDCGHFGDICCGGFCRFGDCCGDVDCTDPGLPACLNNVCTRCRFNAECGPDRVCCGGECRTGQC